MTHGPQDAPGLGGDPPQRIARARVRRSAREAAGSCSPVRRCARRCGFRGRRAQPQLGFAPRSLSPTRRRAVATRIRPMEMQTNSTILLVSSGVLRKREPGLRRDNADPMRPAPPPAARPPSAVNRSQEHHRHEQDEAAAAPRATGSVSSAATGQPPPTPPPGAVYRPTTSQTWFAGGGRRDEGCPSWGVSITSQPKAGPFPKQEDPNCSPPIQAVSNRKSGPTRRSKLFVPGSARKMPCWHYIRVPCHFFTT